jgi:hypothetical protein
LYFVPQYGFWVQGVGGGESVQFEKRTVVQLYCTISKLYSSMKMK